MPAVGEHEEIAKLAAAAAAETIAKVLPGMIAETIKQIVPLIGAKRELLFSELHENDFGNLTPKISMEDVVCTSGKIEGFPKEFRDEVNKILIEMKEKQSINYSAVARFCIANGHKVSFMGVKRYYCKYFK